MTALNKQAGEGDVRPKTYYIHPAAFGCTKDPGHGHVPVVKADDFEKLRAKLEAAEKRIAELSASHSKLRDTMATIHNTIRMDGGYTPLAAILNAAKRAHEESATDAFLAEVRASELDSLAGVAETMLVKFSNQQCSSDMHEVVGWKMVLQQASNRAAQLRKGVRS
ncbi:hypothetical protein NFJ76_08865 [Citrobacter freundii]|uniref:hypothetical protein n=1 Tax=Citrobacter freundii TaxID=546 RepID=UPI002433E542|nr:hypothetical protein [Citrobacter freundii]WFW62051.1 hypothetical protein NFJ76_08865 [Citrobacter freundii]